MPYRRALATLCLLAATIAFTGCETVSTTTATETDPKRVVSIRDHQEYLIGNEIFPGDRAPDFRAHDADFKVVSLKDFAGKIVVISAVPSLDTKVCSLQTIKFNSEAARLPKNVVVLTISADLPFAQKRFCSAENVDKTLVLSDAGYHEFGDRYGIRMRDRGLLARSVWIVNPWGEVVYREIVPNQTAHPDYKTALAAARGLSEKTW